MTQPNQLSDEQLEEVAGGLRTARLAGSSNVFGLSQLNTKTQRWLAEANDAEARYTSLMNDYKSLLDELRKG